MQIKTSRHFSVLPVERLRVVRVDDFSRGVHRGPVMEATRWESHEVEGRRKKVLLRVVQQIPIRQGLQVHQNGEGIVRTDDWKQGKDSKKS